MKALNKHRVIIKRICGASLLAAPYVAIGSWLWYYHGFTVVIILYGSIGLLVGSIILGTYLLND